MNWQGLIIGLNILENKYMKCKHCEDLEEMCWEYPDELHHGEEAYCPECGAEYYREYEGQIFSTNEQAKLNHPNLKMV